MDRKPVVQPLRLGSRLASDSPSKVALRASQALLGALKVCFLSSSVLLIERDIRSLDEQLNVGGVPPAARLIRTRLAPVDNLTQVQHKKYMMKSG